MTKEELAAMLDGRQYHNETTREIERIAEENDLLIVFGYSDDLCEFRGAIHDEFGCYDGGVIKSKDLPKSIEAIWCPRDVECSWVYKTELPHAKFTIYEEDEVYCIGIVIDLKEIRNIESSQPCSMCFNARIDPNAELADDNDYSYKPVGKSKDGFRIGIGAGDGRPVRIEFEMWSENCSEMITVGRYHPRFCPNCGRRLTEYEAQ